MNDTLTQPQETAAEIAERRYVYNGEFAPGGARTNRPVRRRRRSTFNIVAALATISLVIVFYIWNKITVNRLAEEVNDLQMQYQKTLYANENVRATINKKSSLERIGKIATADLGLTYPREQPVWFAAESTVGKTPEHE
jgi:cell division protein FtsL